MIDSMPHNHILKFNEDGSCRCSCNQWGYSAAIIARYVDTDDPLTREKILQYHKSHANAIYIDMRDLL